MRLAGLTSVHLIHKFAVVLLTNANIEVGGLHYEIAMNLVAIYSLNVVKCL